MAAYRDQDNSIWVTGTSDHVLYCLIEPGYEDGEDYSVGLALGFTEVNDAYGPLTEVTATGWEEVR